jgi:hypothetical protein
LKVQGHIIDVSPNLGILYAEVIMFSGDFFQEYKAGSSVLEQFYLVLYLFNKIVSKICFWQQWVLNSGLCV